MPHSTDWRAFQSGEDAFGLRFRIGIQSRASELSSCALRRTGDDDHNHCLTGGMGVSFGAESNRDGVCSDPRPARMAIHANDAVGVQLTGTQAGLAGNMPPPPTSFAPMSSRVARSPEPRPPQFHGPPSSDAGPFSCPGYLVSSCSVGRFANGGRYRRADCVGIGQI